MRRVHGLPQNSPFSAFGLWDLRMAADAPSSVPNAEMSFPLPCLGLNLHSSEPGPVGISGL